MTRATELMLAVFKRYGELWPKGGERAPEGITFNPSWVTGKDGETVLGVEVHADNDDLDMASAETVEEALQLYLDKVLD